MAPPATLDAMPTTAAASKADSKKQRRKEEAAAIARHEQALKQLVQAAAGDPDPLRSYAAFANFNRNGLQAHIKAVTAEAMPPALSDWALGLCRANMQQLYEAVWGWSDKKKKRELTDEASRFLVAYEGPAAAEGDAAPAPLAYIHYRFEVEDGVPVAYCYELQLEERAQRKGLGKHLMTVLELMTLRYGMAGVMLTVMRGNTGAVSFYARMGYREHDTSPEAAGYAILFKSLARPARGGGCGGCCSHHHHGHGHDHGHAH